MELLFLQSERELHWPGWSLDAISCAGWIWPTPHLLISYHFVISSGGANSVIYRTGFRASL